MCLDIIINIISDFAFLFIAILLGWVILYLTRRNRLLKFFGIEKSRRIVIYLSNLRVKPFGAIGINGKPRSYNGSTGAFEEINSANRFRELFNYFLPSLSDNPGFLREILISDVQVQIIPSPLEIGNVDKQTTIISMGTPAYNIVSSYIENGLHSRAHFELGVIMEESKETTDKSITGHGPVTDSTFIKVDKHEATNPISTGSSSGTADMLADTAVSSYSQFPSPSVNSEQTHEKKSAIIVEGIPSISESNYGFIERISDKENKRMIFYVAGLSEIATARAADYLVNNWIYLFKKYKYEDEFLIMLRFEQPDFMNTSIIFER